MQNEGASPPSAGARDREQRGHVTVMRKRQRDLWAVRLSRPEAETQAAQRSVACKDRDNRATVAGDSQMTEPELTEAQWLVSEDPV
jgi:hypothetical protein